MRGVIYDDPNGFRISDLCLHFSFCFTSSKPITVISLTDRWLAFVEDEKFLMRKMVTRHFTKRKKVGKTTFFNLFEQDQAHSVGNLLLKADCKGGRKDEKGQGGNK